MESTKIELLEKQLRIAKDALTKIVKWNEDLEYEWGDSGYFAKDVLMKIEKLNQEDNL